MPHKFTYHAQKVRRRWRIYCVTTRTPGDEVVRVREIARGIWLESEACAVADALNKAFIPEKDTLDER